MSGPKQHLWDLLLLPARWLGRVDAMRVMIAVGVSMGGTRWTKCVSCGGRVRHALAAKVCFYTNGLSCGGGEAFHMRHSPVIPRGSHALHGSRYVLLDRRATCQGRSSRNKDEQQTQTILKTVRIAYSHQPITNSILRGRQP